MLKINNKTEQAVWSLVEPYANEIGVRIWDVRFVKEGTEHYLRIFIDKATGISIDDCERLSRAIDGPLEDRDLIKVSYCLEVSSPGLERRLTRDDHYIDSIGKDVLVRLIRPVNVDQRDILGSLVEFNSDEIKIKLEDGELYNINKKSIAFVQLDDFKQEVMVENE